MIQRVDLKAQYSAYRDEINAAVAKVFDSGKYTLGPETAAFEAEFSRYIGVKETIGVADGTRAIAMALQILGVKPGDEVITTAFTAVPTIGAILETGATPVFADIDIDTYLLDIDRVLEKITDKTCAIVPVHMFGNVFDIPKLRSKLPCSIPIVEDAAQAHGSRLGSEMAGSLGDLATFSFYPTKNLGGYGDGGAVTTNNADLAKRLRLIRNHGMVDKDICSEPGVNSRLDEMQSAILRVKLRHLDAMNEARAIRAKQYISALPSDQFTHQRITTNAQNNWHVFQSRFRGNRDALVAHLDALGVQTNIYYVVPHHLQPAFAHLGYKKGDLPNLERLCLQAIALPIYPEIAETTVAKVIEGIASYAAAPASTGP